MASDDVLDNIDDDESVNRQTAQSPERGVEVFNSNEETFYKSI